MKKQLLITSVLAFGMGIAGAQTQAPAPMQGGTAEPGRGTAPQQPISPGAAAQVPGTPINSETAAPQSFKGCLNGSPGSWNLAADDGKNLVLSGTDDQLSPYKGQQVKIHGIQASDGTVKIDSIDQLSASCTNQPSSSMGAQSSSTEQNNLNNQSSTSTTSSTTQSTTTTQPSSTTESNMQPGATTTPDTSGAVSGQNSSTAGVTTPPVTNQTPTNSVGSGTEQSAQNPSAGNAAGNTGQSTSADQNANQGVRHYSDIDQNAGQELPQTASPLPLLGLLGLGSLVAGLIGRRKK